MWHGGGFRVDDAFCSQLAAGTGTATVLLMFVPGAEAERGEPGELAEPMLCQFFDKLTLRCLVLGVALVPQADSLLQHAEWIRRRLALLTRSPQHDAPLACCSGALAEGAAPVRMDAPLCEQQVVSGCALTFETAPCGRRGASQARGPEQCGAVLAQLVHQPPPVTIHGCVSLDARSRSSADLDAWSAFHRLFCEEVSKEVSLELLPAAASGPGPARAGSVMIFRILPHRNMAAASAVAVELCTLFSTPKEGGKRCLCRGRFARHRPRELLLTAGTACGGARALWRAHAPGVGARGSAEFGHLANREATSLTAMLHSMGVPVGEVEVFEVGPPPGCDTLPATTVELEESPSEGVKSRRSRRKAQAAREAQAADCAGAEDCGGSPAAERPAHECRSGRRPSSTELEEPAELASAVESAEDDDDEAEAEEAQSHQGSTIDGASGASHHRPSFNLSASTEEIGGADAVAPQPTATPCPDFAAAGLCLEGARCPFAHPRGAQLARPEPCPLRSESRERCALRHLCAFAHGEAERACPPYIRARPPGGERQSAASPGEGQAHGPAAAEDTASGLVRRLLHQSTEQLCGLLEQARALSMTEEVEGVERQLLPLFLHRGPVQSQKATPVARSVALSRSSSCDSFFDEPGGRDAAQAARLLLAQAAAGEATQPSTPRSLTHTPGGHAARPQPDSGGKSWPPEGDALETARSQISALLLPLGSAAPVPSAASQPPLELPAEARHAPSSSPLHRYADEPHADQPLRSRARDESERLVVRPPRLDRRPGAVGGGVQSMGYLWHTSPFCISRTPNIHTPAIHTPVSHCSPARSPASFSGYCSPITAMPSGVASPNQRRSQSGYSSPSADRGLLGSAFFVGTATAHSGLMRRLMSLREARGEDNEEESEWSSGDEVPGGADAGMPDLLDNLLQNAQRLPLSRGTKEPSCLCLDLSTEFSGYMKRGLVMNRAAPYLNAFLQVLLPCSPLMHLLAQLSWSSLAKQRPAYACLVQIAGKFFGTGHRVGAEERNIGMAASADGPPSPQGGGWRLSAADPSGPQGVQPPVDAAAFAEPLLRRFERGKNTSAPTPPAPGLVETFLHFVHFVLGQLHDECKWPTLSPITGHHEDSPVSRIFECLLRRPKAPQRTAADASAGAADTVPLLVLHLDLASAPCLSVSEALQQLLRPPGSHFIRLPPFLLLHLQRFKMVDGVPTKISRHCTMDTWLQLEEAAHCTSRTVTYELRSAACHYGEAPEGGTYKALARSGAPPRGAALGGALGAATAGGAGDWYAFDDAAVRLRPAEELGALLQCEGHHVCFLVYRREDTRTVNMRPHAA
ncbi:unnamed protein product [Prorocentrum cordatum]|uniref:ubiquitinyl hydrolase 1 n=1 Tax=Prorocentrum cordatum TaxID=2364126 RepID=A0ABN9Y1J0_9DINO|nr:unnamed protein product [Polarella glacialis]